MKALILAIVAAASIASTAEARTAKRAVFTNEVERTAAFYADPGSRTNGHPHWAVAAFRAEGGEGAASN